MRSGIARVLGGKDKPDEEQIKEQIKGKPDKAPKVPVVRVPSGRTKSTYWPLA